MLRLRCCVLAHLRSSPATSHGSHLHRLISAAAPVISPNPSFAVEDYLVATCGLSRAQALKASAKLSHLKSPTKPDAVLSFLAARGFSGSDVAAVVAGDPKILCSSVEGYLGPFVAQLAGLGLSPRSEFLISEVGLEPAYIAHRPTLLAHSLDGRLRPRYCVVKFLKENELLDRDRDYYSAVRRTEKVFVEKYIHPHLEAAPHLVEDYVEVCRGKVPTRFRFA